jgi:hypothetical protein
MDRTERLPHRKRQVVEEGSFSVVQLNLRQNYRTILVGVLGTRYGSDGTVTAPEAAGGGGRIFFSGAVELAPELPDDPCRRSRNPLWIGRNGYRTGSGRWWWKDLFQVMRSLFRRVQQAESPQRRQNRRRITTGSVFVITLS